MTAINRSIMRNVTAYPSAVHRYTTNNNVRGIVSPLYLIRLASLKMGYFLTRNCVNPLYSFGGHALDGEL